MMTSAGASLSQHRRFWLLALLSLAGYVALSLWFPLRPYFNHSPSPDIRFLAPSLMESALYAILLCSLFIIYWLAYRYVKKRGAGLSWSLVLVTAAAFCLPLIFTFPVNATDAYRYFLRGRISSVHRQSPYSTAVDDLSEEPYAPLAGEWASETSPYGPIWETAAAGITFVSADNLWLGLLAFKIFAALCFLAAGVIIWLSSAGVPGSRRAGLLLLWVWNPSLLLIFAVDGNNDALMLLMLLVGWLLIARDRPQWGMIVMLTAPLVKPIGLLPLPFFFVSIWQQYSTGRERLRFLLTTILGAILLVWVAFSPFGSPFGLAGRLLSEAGSGGGFTPMAWLILEGRNQGTNLSIQWATRLGSLLLIFLFIWLLWRTWRGRSPLRAAADIFAGYIIQAFRFRIWYAAWPLPWLLLDKGRKFEEDAIADARLATGITFLLTSQLSVLIYGQVRTELLASSQLRAHRIGIIFTFLLPLLAGLAVAFYNARLRDRQKER